MLPALEELLQQNFVPDNIIKEIREKPIEYQERFLYAIRKIIQNEVLSLYAFMVAREKLKSDKESKNSLLN